MGGYPPPHSGRNSTNFPPKTAFFAQKTLFLGLFLTKKKLTERGGTPPPPIADGFFLKTNGKKLAERGGTPPPPIADGKTNGKKLAERGGTPPLTGDTRDSGF